MSLEHLNRSNLFLVTLIAFVRRVHFRTVDDDSCGTEEADEFVEMKLLSSGSPSLYEF